jgi:hypothetical protein
MRSITVTLLVGAAVLMTAGCAQDNKPFSTQGSSVAQDLPQETANKDLHFYLVNGHVPASVLEAIKSGNLEQLVSEVANLTAATCQAAAGGDDGFSMSSSGPAGTHTMNVNIIFRSWGDSSQGGEAQGQLTQETVSSQDVRAAIELLLQLQQALQGQQSGTAGQASEGGTAEAAGGDQDFEAKIDAMLERLLNLEGQTPTSQPVAHLAPPGS